MTYFAVHYRGEGVACPQLSTLLKDPRLSENGSIDVPAGPAIILKRRDKKEP